MIKAVIFDLDNTLIDFLKMKTISIEEAVSSMIGAGLKQKKRDAIKRIFEIYDQIGMESKMIFQKYIKEVNGKIDYRILGAGIAAYRRVHTSFYEPYPHVIPMLIRMREKGIKLAILTDAPKLKAWIRLCSIKADPFFDVVVTYDDTKRLKPNKKPFLFVLKKLSQRPEECLMVGDNIQRDILGAKRVGMKTCHARYGLVRKQNSKAKPDNIIKSFDELGKVLWP